MTDQEAITYLKGQTKPYIHIGMSQSSFSSTVTRFEAGLLKPRTLASFLERFGLVKINGQWQNGR